MKQRNLMTTVSSIFAGITIGYLVYRSRRMFNLETWEADDEYIPTMPTVIPIESSSEMFKYHRGVYVKDKITGFAGVIVARVDSITGCNRYLVQPGIDKDGKYQDGVFIDEHSITIDETKQQLKLHREVDDPPG